MVDHLDSKNFVPFARRRGFRIPGMSKDRDEELLEQVDPDLRPEDEGVVRRYLNYADILLGSPDHHGLTLVPGGGPAKRLAGNAETQESAQPQQSADREQLGRTAQTQQSTDGDQPPRSGRQTKRSARRTKRAKGDQSTQRAHTEPRAQNEQRAEGENNSAPDKNDDTEAA